MRIYVSAVSPAEQVARTGAFARIRGPQMRMCVQAAREDPVADAARHGEPKMTMWTAPSLRSASSLIRPPLRN